MSAPNGTQSMNGVPLLQVHDLQVEFALKGTRQTLKAVNGVSFDVAAGETFGIIGESGSGKTTLGRALVSLVAPTRGRIAHAGVDPTTLTAAQLRVERRQFQIIFQDPNASLNPRMKIGESVAEPLLVTGTLTRQACHQAAQQALERVGLSAAHADRYPHQLSGGQKQRANIARALTLHPRLLVCDEVVAALDVSIRGEVLNLFAELQRELGLTYVFITHDLSVVAHISDRVAVMYLGRFMEMGPAESVAHAPLHPYTQALLSAEPVPLPASMRQEQRMALNGDIPSPVAPPSGCVFRTRCPHALPVCAEQVPAWNELKPGHWVACHIAQADPLPAI